MKYFFKTFTKNLQSFTDLLIEALILIFKCLIIYCFCYSSQRDELRDSQETFDYVASENKKTQENYEHMLKKAHIELSRKDEELDETIKLYKSRIKSCGMWFDTWLTRFVADLELELEESDFVARKLTKQKQDLETRAVESEASLMCDPFDPHLRTDNLLLETSTRRRWMHSGSSFVGIDRY